MSFLNENIVIAFCFIIFIYLVYRPVKKVIVTSLDKKIIDIKNNLLETEKLKLDAQRLLEEVKQEINNFVVKKQKMLESAENNSRLLMTRRMTELENMLEREKMSAISTMNHYKDQSIQRLSNDFTDSVLTIVRIYLSKTQNNDVTDEQIIRNIATK